MRTIHLSDIRKSVITLVLCTGVLPFINNASAHARGEASIGSMSVPEVTEKKSTAEWLWEDYMQPVGLTYNAEAKIQTTYLWRGQFCGGPNIQASANVGYGGAYIDMWWNVGTYDWRFESFQPEVDLSIGFKRYGLNIYLLYVHHFDCPFFDFNNGFGGGNRLEVNAKWTLSNKIPLTIHWGTRVAAADGYYKDTTDNSLTRAYSSYLEISYVQNFKYGISLTGAIGITPWKSTYTSYVHDAGVVNIDLKLRKDWSLSDRCGMMLQGQVCVNPTLLAADPSSIKWDPQAPAGQTVNANVTLGVYLK